MALTSAAPNDAPTAASINGTSNGLAELLQLSPSSLRIAIRRAIKARVPVFIWGEPGIAKSSVLKQIATEMGVAYIDFRLASKQPNDIRGLPFPVTQDGVAGVKWEPALLLPRDLNVDRVHEFDAAPRIIYFHNPLSRSNFIRYIPVVDIKVEAIDPLHTAIILDQTPNSVRIAITDAAGNYVSGFARYMITGKAKGIVGLDEFNSAIRSVQGATYSLFLDRQIDDYDVPEDVYLAALGNNDTDGGVTYTLAKPIENRMIHLFAKMEYADWAEHAMSARFNPIVQGFYKCFPHLLHKFDVRSPSRSFPTARTAEFLSNLMNANTVEEMSDPIGRSLITGAIGNSVGMQFVTYMELASKMIDPDDVLRGKVSKFDNRHDISLCVVMATSLLYILQSEAEKLSDINKRDPSPELKNWMIRADNFIGFMRANYLAPIMINVVREAVARCNLPMSHTKMPNYRAFYEEHGASMMGRSGEA